MGGCPDDRALALLWHPPRLRGLRPHAGDSDTGESECRPLGNFQIRELTDSFPEYERRGVTPVAISVDRAEESAKTRATYDIPFPVLSDPDLVAHRAFRVVHQSDGTEVERLKGMGMDLEKSSGRSHHQIAVPSLFVIDRAGVVRWAHADADYKVRPSPAQILEAIDGLDLRTN